MNVPKFHASQIGGKKVRKEKKSDEQLYDESWQLTDEEVSTITIDSLIYVCTHLPS